MFHKKEIKEITIRSSHVLMHNPDYYKDELQILITGISYKRTNYKSGEISSSWSYKTTNKEYAAKFGILTDKFNKIWSNKLLGMIRCTDCGSYSIKITYSDDSECMRDFTSDFKDNKMTRIANAIVDMIPCGEVYPDLIKLNGVKKDLKNL